MKIATTNIPIIKLFKHSLWKKSNIVIIVATLKKIDNKKPIVDNYLLNSLIAQINLEGTLKKKLSAKKFYYLYYQMTELIPLFSYLERLNALKSSFRNSIT